MAPPAWKKLRCKTDTQLAIDSSQETQAGGETAIEASELPRQDTLGEVLELKGLQDDPELAKAISDADLGGIQKIFIKHAETINNDLDHNDAAPEVTKPQQQASDREEDNLANIFWQEMKKKGFNVPAQGTKGNAIAGRWARYLASEPEEKERYESLVGRTAKSNFRKAWCEQQYSEFQQHKKHSETFKMEFGNDSYFYSLRKICVEEGNDMQAAANYCIRCFQEGKEWYEYNDWTKTIKFKYSIKCEGERHGQHWELEKKWSTAPTGSSGGGSSSGGAAKAKAKAGAAAKATSKGGSPAKKEAKTGGAKATAKAISPQVLATKLKSTYASAMLKADDLLWDLEVDPAWEWLPAILQKPLKEARAGIEKVARENTAAKDLTKLDAAELKKKWGTRFTSSLALASDALESPISKLHLATDMLYGQQEARHKTMAKSEGGVAASNTPNSKNIFVRRRFLQEKGRLVSV